MIYLCSKPSSILNKVSIVHRKMSYKFFRNVASKIADQDPQDPQFYFAQKRARFSIFKSKLGVYLELEIYNI